MTSEAQVAAPALPCREPWPPHDTEESILGSDLHQTTIRGLASGINEAAHLLQTAGEPIPWKALSQTAILGCERLDGSPLRTDPDVFVYTRFIDPRRGSVSIAFDGPPLLVLEVLSDSTYESDIDVRGGKGYSYARASVTEYLTLDPTGEWIPEYARGWRLREGRYDTPWLPDANGRWQSESIPVAFAFEGVMATVFTRDGRKILREGEVSEVLQRQSDEIEALRRRLGDD